MSYRGNSVAVAIGYDNVGSNTSQLIQVYKSTFFNNSATTNTSFQTSTNIHVNRTYTGRGGALSKYNRTQQTGDKISVNVISLKTMHAHMEEGYT